VIKTKLAEWRAKVGGGHDYQFFDDKRLDELEKLEKVRTLTRYEKAEQEKLMKEGFPNFSRRCFQTVTRFLEDMGSSDETVDRIHEALPEWSREDLARYVDVLFASGKKFLGNHFMVRFLNKVKRIEKQNEQVEARMEALDRKVNDFNKTSPSANIWDSLPVDSAPIEDGSAWTNSVDRVLLCGTFYYGYGGWGSLKQLTRVHPRTCWNFAAHIKSAEEVKARVDELLEIVEEEFPKKSKKTKKNS
jgi:hypothetical protein